MDDNDGVLLLLSVGLRENGFDVLTARSGEDGLALAMQNHPDVILLDVMMPQMSGLQVCETLQNDAGTRNIPIIFLSARSAPPDRIIGLEQGAVDYVTKPFDLQEVLTRVRVVLRSRERVLEHEAALERLKKEFVRILSHEMAAPLTAIRGFTELLETGWSRLGPSEQMAYLQEIDRNSLLMAGTLDDLLALVESENFSQRQTLDLVSLVQSTASTLEVDRVARKQVLELNLPAAEVRVVGHQRFLARALYALLSNAQKFGSPGGVIKVQLACAEDAARLTVTDNGPGIPPGELERIFDKFYQVDASRTRSHDGMGVGLAVARRVARGLGGDVSVDSELGHGARFTLMLPAAV